MVRRFTLLGILAAAFAFALALSCHGGPNAAFTELTEARRLVADLRVQLNKASDSSNRAVMADTDEASVAFAREAERTRGVVQTDVAALAPRLQSLAYPAEIKFFDEFKNHFAEYETLDRTILEYAVENTNLKAQRLSFGPAQQASDAFRDMLTTLVAHVAAKDRCRVESLVGKAVVAVREMQVLHAPHIAESDDAVMTRLEKELAAREATARDAVNALPELVDRQDQAQVATAIATLDRFQGISKEIVKLSRRNSNVRSLELSLRQKPTLTAACDESLRGLQDALAKEMNTGTR
jgi:hypothetical protein